VLANFYIAVSKIPENNLKGGIIYFGFQFQKCQSITLGEGVVEKSSSYYGSLEAEKREYRRSQGKIEFLRTEFQ
jgi:hypothetical protein